MELSPFAATLLSGAWVLPLHLWGKIYYNLFSQTHIREEYWDNLQGTRKRISPAGQGAVLSNSLKAYPWISWNIPARRVWFYT